MHPCYPCLRGTSLGQSDPSEGPAADRHSWIGDRACADRDKNEEASCIPIGDALLMRQEVSPTGLDGDKRRAAQVPRQSSALDWFVRSGLRRKGTKEPLRILSAYHRDSGNKTGVAPGIEELARLFRIVTLQ